MSMYRFFQKEEDGPWFPIPDGPKVLTDALHQGAKKLTILAVDKPLSADDAKRGNKYSGPLYFDIDLPSVADAIVSANELVTRLIEHYKVPEEAIWVYCSGKKGLHVLVAQKAFMARRTAIKDLPLIYKNMASAMYVSGLDLAPYACGRNNTFRIANIKRYDGNYRVPIRITELRQLDAESYARFVSRPRDDYNHVDYDGAYSIELNMLFVQASDQLARYDKELTERSRVISQSDLQVIADQAPPCVELIAEYKGLKGDASFNQVALNLALWASRAGAPELERNRIFAMTADNAERSDRYPTPRSRLQELEGKYKYAVNSPDYRFGCGAMRSMIKIGRKVCEGCALESRCGSKSSTEFISDVAERAGIIKSDSGYSRTLGKGRVEQISTFTLEPHAAYMETMPDGTGARRRGTLCHVKRHGDELGQVIMDEASWASKASFLRALEGIPGVYYIGGDAEIQKIKMLVFLEEETMPEIYQVTAAGIHIEQQKGTDIITYVEPGKSLNNFHMVDTHRLTKNTPLPPTLFKQPAMELGDMKVDQALANLALSNQKPVVAITLGWFIACFLKAHLREAHAQFPLLAIWGGSGAGKSKWVELLACLHGLNCNQRSKANMSTINRFNAVELLSGTTTVPRICEEYNKDKMAEHQYLMLGELFKALWNSESAQRGTVIPGQRSAVSVEIPLTSPAVILGEQQIKMPALQERTLIIKMIKAGRSREPFMRATAGRLDLMRLGQALMQESLRLSVAQVDQMLQAQDRYVGYQFDDRPRYSLKVVHMGLAWLMDIAAKMRLTDSMVVLSGIKEALVKVTQQEQAEEQTGSGISSVLGKTHQTEIDQFLIALNDMAVESGAALYEELNGRPIHRRVWLSPRSDFKVSGDTVYLSKTCHSRYLEWVRAAGRRTPLDSWSDVKQLIETEPYFLEWKSLPDFSFGEPCITLSMSKLEERGVPMKGMRSVYDVLGQLDMGDIS